MAQQNMFSAASQWANSQLKPDAPTAPTPKPFPGLEPDAPDQYPGLKFDLGNFYDGHHDVLSKPHVQLTLAVNQAKVAKMDEDTRIKRATDIDSLPLITKNIEDNQKYVDHLHQQLAEFNAKMQQPYPAHQALGLTTPELVSEGLAAVLGGRVGGPNGVAEAGQHNAEQRIAIEDENAKNKFGFTMQQTQSMVEELQKELARAQGRGDQLQTQQTEEVAHRGDLVHNDLEKAKDRFANAKNPGEAQQAADDLKNLGHPVSDTALQAAVKALKFKESNEVRQAADQQYRMIEAQVKEYGDAGDSAGLDALQGQIDQLNGSLVAQGLPGNYPPVRGGKTEKAKFDENLLGVRKQQESDLAAKYIRDAKIKSKEVAGQLARWQAESEYARGELKVHQDMVGVARLRAVNQKGLTDATAKAERYKMDLDQVNEDLKNFKRNEGESAHESKVRKNRLFSKRDSLQQTYNDAQNGLKIIQRQSDVDNGVDPGTSEPDAPTPGAKPKLEEGATWVNPQNGKTYKRAGGAWHLVG